MQATRIDWRHFAVLLYKRVMGRAEETVATLGGTQRHYFQAQPRAADFICEYK